MNSRDPNSQNRQMIALSLTEIEKITRCADGNAALLYLYFHQCAPQKPSILSAAHALHCSEREIVSAAGKLNALGVSAPFAGQAPAPAEELPEYRAEDLERRSDSDHGFRDVVAEAQRVLGRVLSGADLKILFGIYDYLGLPAEVIMMLLNYCVEICTERYGEGRLPTMRMIEKEAYAWSNRDICTMGRAEAYLQKKKAQSTLTAQIQRELSIRDRALSATERKYIESWVEMGFTVPAIAEAYDRTVIKTGGLRWAYLNSILKNWHAKGLHTLEEINSAEHRRSPADPGVHSYDELNRLEQLLQPKQQGGNGDK